MSQKIMAAKTTSKSASKPVNNKHIILKVKRHWFGLFTIYGLICLGLLVFWLLIIPTANLWQASVLGVVIMMTVLLIVMIILFGVIAKVYWSNHLTLTPNDVSQKTQEALFASRSSILGLGNIEDVTVVRAGIFAHIFNYGTLNIETAGEQDNFKFSYCPKPEDCIRTIMTAREKYLTANEDQISR